MNTVTSTMYSQGKRWAHSHLTDPMTSKSTSKKVQNPFTDQSTPCVRVHLRPGMYHVLVLMELQQICGTGTQGDGSLLNALSRKCYMHTLQYVHRGTLP